MRCRDVDHFHVWVGAQFCNCRKSFAAEVGAEAGERFDARVGGSDQSDTGVAGKSRQHDAEGATEAGNPQAELAVRVHASPGLDNGAAFH
jgi:hypothetical protein